MLDSKTRNEILLEEKVAKIDDINFDKIYDVEEFANKQLENFEEPSNSELETSNNKISSYEDEIEDYDINDVQQNSETSNKPAFELELQPNEFLDNMVWGEDDEIEEIAKKHKFSLVNKPLFYTFTSIALLLCILFIYNVFVIKSLENGISSSANSLPNASTNVTQVVEENNNIVFDNSNSLEIEYNDNYVSSPYNKNHKKQTNWFNEICSCLNRLFGGNY